MTLYRRGSVTVEAIEASHVIARELEDLPDWVSAALLDGRLVVGDKSVAVKTIEGWSTADAKSWIIQRQTEHGELYPITGKAFEERYTRVPE